MPSLYEEVKRLKTYFLSKLGGAVSGDITPSADLTHRLGSASYRWLINHNVGARVYNSATISHATSGAWQIVTFNSEYYDAAGLHSTSTNTSRFTIPYKGVYVIGCHLEFSSNATGVRGLSVFVNGSTVIANSLQPAVSGYSTYLTMCFTYELLAGQYIEMRGFQNSGGALNMLRNLAISPEFSIQLISLS